MNSFCRLGLDEAGYGPTLGPLVVGLVRTRGPADWLERVRARSDPFLPRIDDSKRLYRSGEGFEILEHTALSAVALVSGQIPRRLEDVTGPLDDLRDHPWYGSAPLDVPLLIDPVAVEEGARALRSAVEASGAALEVVTARVLPEGRFNERIAALDNKALVERELIEDLLSAHVPAAGATDIVCDRLGGRHYYEDWLTTLHPFTPLFVEGESDAVSAYRVTTPQRVLRYRFLVQGDRQVAEVALASVVAKYAREVLMQRLNGYFMARHADLAPTSGYPTDARTFLDQIADDEQVRRHRHLLVRQR